MQKEVGSGSRCSNGSSSSSCGVGGNSSSSNNRSNIIVMMMMMIIFNCNIMNMLYCSNSISTVI